MAAGIYIHIPFCKRKCPYCDFYSIVADDNIISQYVESLKLRIENYSDRSISADTVYFGGGTPSLLSPDQVSQLINTVRSSFDISPDCEITMECNPSSVSLSKLIGYYDAGVNRLSFGVQSSGDDELKHLGRLHDFSLAQQAVLDARRAGFINISCDLMIGTPKQTLQSLMNSVRDITSLGVTHISCYMLKIEDGTPYDCDSIRRSVADDDTVSDMYLALVGELDRLGFKQYEISNFSLPGYESRHNTKYWTGEPYIGFGPSAHSYFDGVRTYSSQTVGEFISLPLTPDEIEDSSPDPLEEYILLGLRLAKGISLSGISSLGGSSESVAKGLKPFVDAGYLILDGDTVKLTSIGFLLSNGIISRIIDLAVGENI